MNHSMGNSIPRSQNYSGEFVRINTWSTQTKRMFCMLVNGLIITFRRKQRKYQELLSRCLELQENNFTQSLNQILIESTTWPNPFNRRPTKTDFYPSVQLLTNYQDKPLISTMFFFAHNKNNNNDRQQQQLERGPSFTHKWGLNDWQWTTMSDGVLNQHDIHQTVGCCA